MDLWLKIVDIVRIGGCPHISLLIPVDSSNPIEIADEHILPQVEFSVVVEKRPIYVHLNNKCFWAWSKLLIFIGLALAVIFINSVTTLTPCFSEDVSKLINLVNDCDSIPSVRVLTWLDNPNVSGLSVPKLFFLLLDLLFALLIELHESFVFYIFCTIFYMES